MPNDPFYGSHEWKTLRSKVRARWLAKGLPCHICKKPLAKTDWLVVDHLVPRKLRPDLALAQINLVVLHAGCHSGVKARMERGVVRQIGEDGWPVPGQNRHRKPQDGSG